MQIIFEINSILLFSLFIIFSSWYFLLLISFLKKEKVKKIKKFPKVSVLIPAYNEEKNIKKCLESVKNINYPKNLLEIIVVDDGSTDKTYEIAKKEGVKVYKIKHSGKAKALNFGIEKCSGEYILILDADTIIHKDFILEALKRMNKIVVAVSASMDVLNTKNIVTYMQKVEYIFASLFKKALNSLKTGCLFVFGAATLYRADILKKLKFKDVSTEDFDLAIRIQSKGYKIVQVDVPAKTIVPEKISSLYKQRIRWYSHVLYLFKFYGLNVFKKISSLTLYTLPLTYFWYLYAIIIIPITIYQIFYWIPKDSALDAIFFIFRWFSYIGTLYNICMLQFWQINLNLILGIIVSTQSFVFALISLIYFKQLNVKTFLASLFLYPYFFFIVNISLILSLFKFLIEFFKS
jgi:cellulose synthase/poly-beta-1,6-N-acetylglucosamine synthase-like glycosyltransferase